MQSRKDGRRVTPAIDVNREPVPKPVERVSPGQCQHGVGLAASHAGPMRACFRIRAARQSAPSDRPDRYHGMPWLGITQNF